MPLAPLDVEGELTTPTGAAIVAALADEFGPLPAMTVERIGYGAGQKDFPQPNILRLLVGTQRGWPQVRPNIAPHIESIVVLETNLDDCPGDAIGHAVERLLAAGALDVSLTPIQMKKGRPGVLVSVQARPADADALEAILFRRNDDARRAAIARVADRARPPDARGRNALGPDRRQNRLPARRLTAIHAGIRSLPPRVPSTACRWPT